MHSDNEITYIIAEIASAHDGDPEQALSLFKLASATAANAVKFQIFKRDNLLSSDHPKYSNFADIEISQSDWRSILLETNQYQVDVIIEAYDVSSLEFAREFDFIAGYKFPTSDINNMEMIDLVIDSGKPVYFGVGGATSSEIEMLVDKLKSTAVDAILMHGFQAYPTELADCNLKKIKELIDTYQLPVGYADHINADDTELARNIPVMAMGFGASVIEKHITFDRSLRGRDYYSSLNPDEFSSFVKYIREVDQAIGDGGYELRSEELNYRKNMKCFAVTTKEIATGHILSMDDIAFKRTSREGITRLKINEFIGRKFLVSKKRDKALDRSDFINE